MGRLLVAAVECNYQEVDRQVKEQFIHGLNDKNMLEEIIRVDHSKKWLPYNKWVCVSIGQKSGDVEGPGGNIEHNNRI